MSKGRRVWSDYDWQNTFLGVKREDEHNIPTRILKGPKGDKGDVGPKGDKGDKKGDTGVQGLPGERVNRGHQEKKGIREMLEQRVNLVVMLK